MGGRGAWGGGGLGGLFLFGFFGLGGLVLFRLLFLRRQDGDGDEPQQPQTQGEDLPPPEEFRLHRGEEQQQEQPQQPQEDIPQHGPTTLLLTTARPPGKRGPGGVMCYQ